MSILPEPSLNIQQVGALCKLGTTAYSGHFRGCSPYSSCLLGYYPFYDSSLVLKMVKTDASSSGWGALCEDTEQTPLTRSGSFAGQTEPGSGHAAQGLCSSRRVETASSVSSHDLVSFWQGRPLHLRQLSLLYLFLNTAGCFGPRLIQHPPVSFPFDRSAHSGHQANQENEIHSGMLWSTTGQDH